MQCSLRTKPQRRSLDADAQLHISKRQNDTSLETFCSPSCDRLTSILGMVESGVHRCEISIFAARANGHA